MPTGSPWARLLLGLNVPQSAGLGHNFMSKYPGQEAFCLTGRRSLTEPEGGSRHPPSPGRLGWRRRWRQVALGPDLSASPAACSQRPASARDGSMCRVREAALRPQPSQGAHGPSPTMVAFEKSKGRDSRGLRGALGQPKIDSMMADFGAHRSRPCQAQAGGQV